MARVLFDVNVPRPVSRLLIGHAVEFADQRGWRELTNGDLLAAAERDGFDVMLTADTNLRYRQNLATRRIAIVALSTNAWPVIRDSPDPVFGPSMPLRRDHIWTCGWRGRRFAAARHRNPSHSRRETFKDTMTFKLTKDQSAERLALAAELRTKAAALNAAIEAFNRGVEPLCRAVADAQAGYNATLEVARALAAVIAETAQTQFDARSERWQDGETGIRVRGWIDEWEMNLDELDLDLPEPLEVLDPDLHAGEIEDAPAGPEELESVLRQ